jgi:hypothetical protein
MWQKIFKSLAPTTGDDDTDRNKARNAFTEIKKMDRAKKSALKSERRVKKVLTQPDRVAALC